MMAGVDLVHVPYRGGAPAATDLVGGQIQVIFAPVSESIQHIQAGKLRALAVTTAARLDVLPDVPTLAEFVPGYEASGFAGIRGYDGGYDAVHGSGNVGRFTDLGGAWNEDPGPHILEAWCFSSSDGRLAVLPIRDLD